MIALADYWMGRDSQYAAQLTDELRANAQRTVDLASEFLRRAQAAGVPLQRRVGNGTLVNSGWRPPQVNGATPGAAMKSRHMTCQAVDVFDPDGLVGDWAMSRPGQRALEDIGLWLEHPAATKGWCHLQTVPPGSGRRVFYP